MLQTYVPKDIRIYKTKIIGPLSLRQILCLAVAILLAASVNQFVLIPYEVDNTSKIYIITFLVMPILAFSVSINGLPLEKHLKYFVRSLVMMLFFDKCIMHHDISESVTLEKHKNENQAKNNGNKSGKGEKKKKDKKDENSKKKKSKAMKLTKKDLKEHPEYVGYK